MNNNKKLNSSIEIAMQKQEVKEEERKYKYG